MFKDRLNALRQFKEQTFNRGGKISSLSDDLQDANRKTEFIKNVCQAVDKNLPPLLVASAKDKDKALKKCPGYSLAQSLKEVLAVEDNSSLRTCVELAREVESQLAEYDVDRDSLVDGEVVAKFREILANDFPDLAKHKRNVEKCSSNVNAARSKYEQARKHNVNNNPAGASKVETIKDELEEGETKLEQSQDQFACEMFQLIARESDFCNFFLALYKYRKAYYEKALFHLNQIIPQLEQVTEDSCLRKVYGVLLEDHLRVTERTVAYPVELCCCALWTMGVEEEGLFRIAGGAGKVRRMKLSLDAGCMAFPTALAYRDPHVIATTLKSYLRELPEPLMTSALYDKWVEAARAHVSEQERLRLLKDVVERMPVGYQDNLAYLIRFFNLISRSQDTNKMSPHNLAIVLGPSLMWRKQEDTGAFLNDTALFSSIVQQLISSCSYFFPGEFEPFLTIEKIVNGETHDGIDNKGFDPRTPESNSNITSFSGMKRSQSVNSLDDPPGSPKPVQRKKNKPVAPTPPVSRSGADKPPTSTLPRPSKAAREQKSKEANDPMVQSVGSVEAFLKEEQQVELRSRPKVEAEKKVKTTVATNTEPLRREDLKAAKEMWFLRDSSVNRSGSDRPAIPERPASLKPTGIKSARSAFEPSLPRNYENVSLSSNENLSGDERQLQRTQVPGEKKRKERTGKNGDVRDELVEPESPRSALETQIVEPEALEDRVPNAAVVDPEKNSESPASPPLEPKRSSLPDKEKPCRPPKPEHIMNSSPSHHRALSEGQPIKHLIDDLVGKAPLKRSSNDLDDSSREVLRRSDDSLDRSKAKPIDSNTKQSLETLDKSELFSNETFEKTLANKHGNEALDACKHSLENLDKISLALKPGIEALDKTSLAIKHSHENLDKISLSLKPGSEALDKTSLAIKHSHENLDKPPIAIKHPSTSPPPPPVPAKPRGLSQPESTDF